MRLALGCLLLLLGLPVIAVATEIAAPNAIADFELKDFRGKPHRLIDSRDKPLLVVAFLGVECPLAKIYTVRLNELAEAYAPRGVALIGVNSNQQDSLAEMEAYAQEHNIDYPLLKDPANRVADLFAAERTPEVFVLGAMNSVGERKILYRGRIDDQYLVGGKIRNEPTRHDLRTALEELLAGKAVSMPHTEPIGCHIGRIKQAREDSDVTFSNQIVRLMQKRCVECHREGDVAPFALTDYDEVVGWAETIREVVEKQQMPPWHANPQYGQFANDRHLTEEEKSLLFDWIDAGAPEGDPQQLPPPVDYVAGWQLPQSPDQVVYIRDEPVDVPAVGEVKYQYFRVNPGFEEDKWVAMAEVIPGNRTVVHHVLVFVKPPGARSIHADENSKFLAAYVPGKRARVFPEGMAKRVPAGSELVFQVHYTPKGSPQQDRSKLGLVFADAEQITHEIVTSNAVGRRLEIPPHASDHEVTARSASHHEDLLLLAMMPHMHLRGKSFRYVAEYPDGRQETLLDVPHYDFNWQTAYQLTEPKTLPAGTRMFCRATFDNSAENPFNPDPNRTVRWGDQTWDEMMIGYFDLAVPVQAAESELDEATIARRAAEILAKYDGDGDGQVQRSEVPLRIVPIFNRIDANHDRLVTIEELMQAIQAGRLE